VIKIAQNAHDAEHKGRPPQEAKITAVDAGQVSTDIPAETSSAG